MDSYAGRGAFVVRECVSYLVLKSAVLMVKHVLMAHVKRPLVVVRCVLRVKCVMGNVVSPTSVTLRLVSRESVVLRAPVNVTLVC